MTTGRKHRPLSGAIHATADVAERSWAALVVAAAVVAVNVVALLTGYPTWLIYPVELLGTSIALVMLFVIRHTQAREQAITQRKLDEVIAALPQADDALVSLEHAPDEEVASLGRKDEAVRDRVSD